MKTLTKINIEELANEIISFLERENLASGVSIYFNNKVMRDRGEWGNCTYIPKWETTENVNPHDYFEYCAYDHILSMSFEGVLYEELNYIQGRKTEELEAIFDKYGLYYEFGNMWNLSAYLRDDDIKVEYTEYDRPKETIYLYCGGGSDNPYELQVIMNTWYELSKQVGDQGSCVLGAGFEFEWKNDKYFMGACSPYQDSLSWEEPKNKIQKMLEDIGATNIYYKWGNMD